LFRRTAPLVAVLLMAAGCGSSSNPQSSGGGRTYTIGLLTDLTGPAASGESSSVLGARAGILVARQQGYTFKLVVADTTSTPAGALAGAQKLVYQDHVFAVLADSAVTFGAASFLTSQQVPVVGAGIDGPEWATSRNMFNVVSPNSTSAVPSEFGQFFKMVGVTNLGSLGYGTPTTSADAAEGIAISAQHAGIKVGYLNAKFPLGTTNVGPEVLAMKAAGVNGMIAPVAPVTALALVTNLRQQGVRLKAALLLSGYGADLSQQGPSAVILL
jgi:branched-chain amino acid transport system substrate-binding protein